MTISEADVRLVIRRPRTEVTENNYKVLQFLDLMKDVDEVSELEGEELQKRMARGLEYDLGVSGFSG